MKLKYLFIRKILLSFFIFFINVSLSMEEKKTERKEICFTIERRNLSKYSLFVLNKIFREKSTFVKHLGNEASILHLRELERMVVDQGKERGFDYFEEQREILVDFLSSMRILQGERPIKNLQIKQEKVNEQEKVIEEKLNKKVVRGGKRDEVGQNFKEAKRPVESNRSKSPAPTKSTSIGSDAGVNAIIRLEEFIEKPEIKNLLASFTQMLITLEHDGNIPEMTKQITATLRQFESTLNPEVIASLKKSLQEMQSTLPQDLYEIVLKILDTPDMQRLISSTNTFDTFIKRFLEMDTVSIFTTVISECVALYFLLKLYGKIVNNKSFGLEVTVSIFFMFILPFTIRKRLYIQYYFTYYGSKIFTEKIKKDRFALAWKLINYVPLALLFSYLFSKIIINRGDIRTAINIRDYKLIVTSLSENWIKVLGIVGSIPFAGLFLHSKLFSRLIDGLIYIFKLNEHYFDTDGDVFSYIKYEIQEKDPTKGEENLAIFLKKILQSANEKEHSVSQAKQVIQSTDFVIGYKAEEENKSVNYYPLFIQNKPVEDSLSLFFLECYLYELKSIEETYSLDFNKKEKTGKTVKIIDELVVMLKNVSEKLKEGMDLKIRDKISPDFLSKLRLLIEKRNKEEENEIEVNNKKTNDLLEEAKTLVVLKNKNN